MSVGTIPLQTGGVAVLGVTIAKAGVNAAAGLPATGARYVGELIAIGSAMFVSGAALIRRGRNVKFSAGSELDG